MQTPLYIHTELITPDKYENRVFDMTGRCGFALCIDGDFDVRIMNSEFRITNNTMVVCLPFVDIHIVRVRRASEVIGIITMLENVLSIINYTVSTSNILAIRRHPVLCADTTEFQAIKSSVEEYVQAFAENEADRSDNPCALINQEIVEVRTRLIIAQVLKLYFANTQLEMLPSNHHDLVFQNFMLDLYANFRRQRHVKFYAMRSGLSLKYFSTVVSQISGAGPSEWIETVVVGEAKTLLLNQQANIKQVAASLNFPDASTFTKYFTRLTGMTPRAFRRSMIN